MRKYFFVINDNKCGPYSVLDLQSIDFDKNTLVWHNGLIDWTKAENIKELSTLLEETPPLVPTKTENSTQSIKLEAPIDVNITKMKSYSKDEREEKSRNVVKKVLSETGILISMLLFSMLIAFSTYQILLSANKPDLVSEENQSLFNKEFSRRQSQNSAQTAFGDIMSNYLGFYKYDNELVSSSEFYDINESRMNILKWKTEEISRYTFYFLLGLIILIRYLTLFTKWLNPKGKINHLVIDETSNDKLSQEDSLSANKSLIIEKNPTSTTMIRRGEIEIEVKLSYDQFNFESGQKVFVNGENAPNGKYKTDFMEYINVVDGLISKVTTF